MYNAEYTRSFYNAYGALEWERLQTLPYGRLQAIIHADLVRRYVKPGDRVLDAGAGPGRFSIVAAGGGAKVTVLDISDTQLEIARQKIREAGCNGGIEQFIRGDICDLSMFATGSFDIVICFGGALSYVCEKRHQAAAELTRVAKPGGVILVSVMSRLGPLVGEAQIPDMPNLQNPDGNAELPGIWPVLESGLLHGVLSRRVGMFHAPMYLYTAAELKALFTGCDVKEMAASNAVLREFAPVNDQLAANPAAWATVVELEKKLNYEPGLVDTGSHTILAAVKN
jgi:ubiquinone/menaquinone biosynthesis C-methylase UbiE